MPLQAGALVAQGLSAWDIASDLSAAAIVVIFLSLGAKRMWVYGSFYFEMRAERDSWRRLALRGTDIADEALSEAERAAQVLEAEAEAIRRGRRHQGGAR